MATGDDSSVKRAPVAVVTGANSGLGLETTRGLVKRGYTVVMGARRLSRTQAVAEQLRGDQPGAQLVPLALDLGDLGSVRAFADEVRERFDSLDLLVNNAGVMGLPRSATADGFESHMGINHLGHFALTSHLLDPLEATSAGRVVVVASQSHRWGRLDLETLGMQLDRSHPEGRAFEWMSAYAASKLANLVFAFELDRRLREAGRDLTCVAAHPGYTETGIGTASARVKGSRLLERFFQFGNKVLAQSAEAGAQVSLYAAIAPELEGGEYIGPKGLLEMRGEPTLVGASRRARSRSRAARLWERSLRATGVEFGGL